MQTVLDEVTSKTIDATHVRRRVVDWEDPLNGLYAAIGGWLPDGREASRGAPVLMHEKLMRKFDVDAKRMSALERHGRGGEIVKLEPHAFWMIGNDGQGRREARRPALPDRGCGRELREAGLADGTQRVPLQMRPRVRHSVTRDWLRRMLR